MSMFPKSEQLKIVSVLATLVGIFPWQFISTNDRFLQNVYKHYSNFMQFNLFTLVMLVYVQLFILLNESTIRLAEVFRNMGITLFYTVTSIRCLIIRFKPELRNIIKDIINSENIVSSSGDKMVMSIVRQYADYTNLSLKIYLIIAFTSWTNHIIRPFFVGEIATQGNETIELKSFPISGWLPFDGQVHYWKGYAILFFYTTAGTSFTIYTDLLIFALIIFPSGQLKVLHHILKNFETYKNKAKMEYRQIDDEAAAIVTFRSCIVMHRNIVKYTEDFNKSMNVFMVFDFLQTSFQITCVLSMFLMEEYTIFEFEFLVSLGLCMFYRLFLTYYNANEILLLSENLSFSAYETKWYEQSRNFGCLIRIFVIRCRNPLRLQIGSFGYMTLEALLSVLQACYSYLMLIYRTQAND